MLSLKFDPRCFNLPSHPTVFVGRRQELDEIADLIHDPNCRLLTLVGPGGSGKTRLSVQAAQENVEHFAQGVYFFSLAALNSTDAIIAGLVEMFGIRPDINEDPFDCLLDYLRSRQLLLILDNFEHLLSGAHLVSQILSAAPETKILATSREPLNLLGEWERQVNGMRFPDDDQVEDITLYSAVMLFQERARQVRGNFSLGDDLPDVLRICRLVSGMPLAIELAAAWLRTLSCSAVADEIQKNLDVLSTTRVDVPERHRSIRAVFNESWQRLNESERELFKSLTVFRGSIQRRAAEQVAGASLLTLSSLAAKSLLMTSVPDRYEMHSLLRQYAEEKLKEKPSEQERLRDAHCGYYSVFVADRAEDLKGGRQKAALEEIHEEIRNIQTAWEWACISGNLPALDAMIEGLSLFYSMVGQNYQGMQIFLRTIETLSPVEGEKPTLTWARVGLRLPLLPQDASGMKDVIVRWMEITRQHGRELDRAMGFFGLSALAARQRAFDEGINYLEEALEIIRAQDDLYYHGVIYHVLGSVFSMYGGLDKSETLTRQSLEIRTRIGDAIGAAYSLNNLGAWAERGGHYAEAERNYRKAHDIFIEFGDQSGVAFAKLNLANMAMYRGDIAEMTEMTEAGLRIGREIHSPAPIAFGLAMKSILASLDEDYASAWQLCEQAQPYAQDNLDTQFVVNWGFAVAAFGIGDFQNARRKLFEALDYAVRTNAACYQMLCLPVAASLASNDGDLETCFQILGVIANHPGSPKKWIDQMPITKTLYKDLDKQGGAKKNSKSQKQGDDDLKTYLSTLLSKLDDITNQESEREHSDSQSMQQDQLIEPLSERELEVLSLLAAGMSNREISRQLVIALGTTKTHIHNIYGKLGVSSRTQAISRAHQLDLVS
jgi:predicted ATPase/DNA-binding CsgD family transcriptional regulator